MTLYVMRHADAVPVGGAVTRDADRPLSAKGKRDADVMGSVLARIDPAIALVLTSPFLRAVKTGECVAGAVHPAGGVRATGSLAPGCCSVELVEEIAALGTGSAYIAIGHQPDLSMFIGSLIAGTAHAAIDMQPGSVAKLRISGPAAAPDVRLCWLISPDLVHNILSPP